MKYNEIHAADPSIRMLLDHLNDIIDTTPEQKAEWFALFANIEESEEDEYWNISISAFYAAGAELDTAMDVVRSLGDDPEDLQPISTDKAKIEGAKINIHVSRTTAETLPAKMSGRSPIDTNAEKHWIVAISARVILADA